MNPAGRVGESTAMFADIVPGDPIEPLTGREFKASTILPELSGRDLAHRRLA
jgi:hypothetical protein